MFPCFSIYTFASDKGRWPEYNFCSLLPHHSPAIIPFYVKTYLDADRAKLSLDNRLKQGTAGITCFYFVIGQMNFFICADSVATPVKDNSSIEYLAIAAGTDRTNCIAVVLF